MYQRFANPSGFSSVDCGISGTRFVIGENEATSQTTFRFFFAGGL
jgi:hypothetical protein